MEWQGWFTLAVVVLALAAMVRELAAPDIVMMAALFILAGTGVLTPVETFAGFAKKLQFQRAMSSPITWATMSRISVILATVRNHVSYASRAEQ